MKNYNSRKTVRNEYLQHTGPLKYELPNMIDQIRIQPMSLELFNEKLCYLMV